MYDSKEEGNRSSKDAIKVSEDGLVHAMISKSSPCLFILARFDSRSG